MRLIPPHQGISSKGLPPDTLIEPLIDRTDPLGGHWLWDGDFIEDDGVRVAVVAWEPPGEHRGRYVVARVLWSHAHGESLHRRRFRNKCGLTTCVNPAHFEPAVSQAEQLRSKKWSLPAAYTLPDGSSARLVVVRRPPGPSLVHIAREDSLFAACGTLSLRESVTSQPIGTPITCFKCLEAWAAFDRPLEEVP